MNKNSRRRAQIRARLHYLEEELSLIIYRLGKAIDGITEKQRMLDECLTPKK